MINDENLYTGIEDYLKGNLTEKETANFEERLKSDADLAALTELQYFENQVIREAAEKDIREKMATWEPELKTKKTPRRIPIWRNKNWAIAAALILTSIFVVWLFIPSNEPPITDNSPPDIQSTDTTKNQDIAEDEREKIEIKIEKEPEKEIKTNPPSKIKDSRQIALNNYSKPAYLGNKKSNDTAPKTAIGEAITAIQNENYQKAINILKEETQKQEIAKEILAHAYFQNENYEKAAEHFKDIYQKPIYKSEIFDKSKAQFCYILSLAANYQKNKNKVDQEIQKLDEDYKYYEKALKLKKDLNE